MDLEHLKEAEEYFDKRYVKRDECNDIQKGVNKHFSENDTKITVLGNSVGTITKLLWVIASTSVSGLATAVLQIILK